MLRQLRTAETERASQILMKENRENDEQVSRLVARVNALEEENRKLRKVMDEQGLIVNVEMEKA